MSYSFDSKNDPDHARAGLSKLQAQHRREKKSLIREMRKEARTEAVVRSEEGKRRDHVYEEKMRVAHGIMKGGNAGVGKWERDQKRKRR
jgi:nucleolar protein 14